MNTSKRNALISMSEGFPDTDCFFIALLLMYYLFPFLFKPLFSFSLLLLNFIITFGALFYFEAFLYTHIHLKDLIENAFCLSGVCVCVCVHCLFTHSSPGHCRWIKAYDLPVLAHVIYLYCSLFVPPLNIPFFGLCCRWELISAVCSQLVLVSRVWERTGKVCREVSVWCRRGERGMFGALSGLGLVFPSVFPINPGRKFHTSLAQWRKSSGFL